MSMDMSVPKDENGPSDYDKALCLLKDNRTAIRYRYALLPIFELEECWSKIKSERNISEDQKYNPWDSSILI
ncbi:hypothetical protein V1508DRAFT_397242 [Lipomyces doorenjongii]|uniref:uncharacterized protein n=1 Tax=Lipomyces doorenjongii TaxID=383834 RepID=UPI0034CD0D2E